MIACFSTQREWQLRFNPPGNLRFEAICPPETWLHERAKNSRAYNRVLTLT
jgi:L,D-peptidoglycan transpeptidase YkuD (ErfK/YbiS/YcfS/YnhG family)